MLAAHQHVGHANRGLARRPARGERGATLVIALVAMIVMGVLVSAVLTYAATSASTVNDFRQQRAERYAGDAAIKAAINWAATQPKVGRDPDPNLGLSNDPCQVNQSVTINGKVEKVKVSCKADKGGQSGKPTEVGLSTPESMVLLSDRLGEPGPLNARKCSGWWDSVVGFFTQGDPPEMSNPTRGLIPERGAWFMPRSGTGTAGATCNSTYTRAWGNFKIRGNVAVKSSVRVDNGTLTVIPDASGAGTLYARAGNCSGVTCAGMTNRPNTYTGVEAYLNGTPRDSDPGRTSPNSPAQTPTTDTAAPFRAVGFNADGSLASGASLPERTTAYSWDSATNVLTPIATCASTSQTVVFMPGWYKSASVLNQYTANGACADSTFWFAPDPGPDNKLLTDDDKTGAFYLDFRGGSNQNCGPTDEAAAIKSRWCIGGSTSQNSRVVVGTPNGWTPQGSYSAAPGGGDTRPRTAVVIDTADTVDEDLSQSWDNGGDPDPNVAAKKIDNNLARYHANICFFWCFSSDRAIRVRDFQPKVTAPAIDVSGAPRGRIYLSVAYKVQNPNSVNSAKVIIEAVSKASGRKSCGTYELFGNEIAAPYGNKTSAAPFNSKASADSATGLHTYTFNDAQAKALAEAAGGACGRVDLINGFEVKVEVRGNNLNTPTVDWWLDGVRFNYDATRGASFPAPSGSGSTSQDVAAKSDCDATKAGGQLIFGGDSHVYVQDGTLEVCAGPYPAGDGDSAENHQSIGVYAVPSIAEILPTGTIAEDGNSDLNSLTTDSGWTTTTALQKIDGRSVYFNYGSGCFACSGLDARARVTMNGYTPPTGYKIQKITARVGYNPKNDCLGFLGCPGDAAQLQTNGSTNCGTQDFPKHGDFDTQVADLTGKVTLYDDSNDDGTIQTGSGEKNCLNVTASGASLPSGYVVWHARAAFCGFIIAPCGGYSDELDGIAYQITITPTSSSTPRLIPQTGCIVVHPNYNGGAGQPDCALIRATSSRGNDNYTAPWNNPSGDAVGRASVKGTLYAPSSAVEIDDTDAAYPLATRGIVLRYLRVSGFGVRTNYDGVAVDSYVDRTPAPREMVFTACIDLPPVDATTPCKKGEDRIVTRSRVRYEIDSSEPVVANRAKLPVIQWWSDDR